jgi:hypothetical protein
LPDPLLDELNAVTLKEIYPKVIEDNFFLDTPFLAYLRNQCLTPFGGGAFMQNVFLYKPLIGGAYARGGSFNISKRQTIATTQFDPKYYEVAVPEYKEDIQVLNKGALAVFKLIDVDLKNAMNTMNGLIAIAMARHGQPVGTGVTDNRSLQINGWIEALNDGVTPGWDGNYFPTYGQATRNGVVGSALNSIPYWVGQQSGAGGPISYNQLEETYQDCCIGLEEPNLGVCNKSTIAFIKERIQPQQRFAQEKDPLIGMTGFKFNSAMILRDDYWPSAKYGANDPDLGNWLTTTFTSPGSGLPIQSNMPASTVLTVGEVFCWFTIKKFFFRVSDDPEYGFGWSGFMPHQENTRVVGHVKAAVNLECTAPRQNKQLFGING